MTARRLLPLGVLAVLLAACLAPAAAGAAGAPRFVLTSVPSQYLKAHGTSSSFLPSPVTVGRATVAPLGSTALPAAYDLRSTGRLTAVRNQGSYGTCWAFAANAALESALLPGETADYSEDNMIARNGWGPFAAGIYRNGGTLDMAAAYWVRWYGPVDEAADPYLSDVVADGPVLKHVQGLQYIPSRSGSLSNGAIKRAVMTYGAVATSMRWPSADTSSKYWDGTHDSFYLPSTTRLPNHGVAIVGWDDAFRIRWFSEDARPPGRGAFLVRNSWGSSFGDGGYFWVSYYDRRLARTAGLVSMAVTRVDDTSTYATNYGYDNLGWTKSLGLGSKTGWFANKFTAAADGSVAAAGFYVQDPGSTYKVFAGSKLGTLQAVGSGTVGTAGFSTVSFTTPLAVTAGQPFVVAVRLTVPGSKTPIPLEAPIPYVRARSSTGQSYVRASASATWMDLAKHLANANVCLRAFTTSP